ncbi:MAG: N-acetylmuramoyl-L-alanine amidase [Elusimicrobiales bacterium]|nr:N-acetylmuramoyl-L-alanine amidase [Elusimicrobiales bacterium]
MPNRNPLLPALLALLAAAPLSAGQINFVYPSEGSSLPAVAKTFVFGSVSPSTSAFLINGEKVAVHSNGGFIAYVPVAGGDFIFTGALDDGTTAQRRVKVRQPEPPGAPDALRLDFTSYASDAELLPGDYLKVTASGTPGHEAVFSLEDVFKDRPLVELPAGSGRYYGSYQVKEGDKTGGELRARFKAGLFARGASAAARGRVKLVPGPALVETSTDTVILKNATDGGYMMFLPKGVKLVSDGRANGYRRVRLGEGEQAWVDDTKVQPAGGAPFPFGYGSETGVIRLKKTDFGSSAVLTLYDRLPYTAEVLPWGLRLTLYYANLHTNWVVYDSADALVKNVAFRQAGTGKVEIDFETGPGELWGYNVSYPNGSRSLQVDLRAKPKVSLAWPRPLSGATVVLDPGHSPYYKCENNTRLPLSSFPYAAMAAARCYLDGAVGPKESYEVNINMALALRLQEKLSALGAQVKLTRNGDENVDLADRPKVAQALGGDLFISIHNNAIGDGEDPAAQPRGFSVYHYQRHSRDLAAALHRSYLKNIDLPDEGLRYGDYLVARMTWMPAALVENAYMILPRQEELLNSPAFQARLADTLAEGVLEFFGAPARGSAAKR